MAFRPRMMSRLAMTGLCLLVLAGYSKCIFVSSDEDDSGDGVPVIEGDDFVTTLILRDSTGAASTSFVMGESIRFDLQVQNTSGHPVSLTLPTAQIYDFYVLDAATSNLRWRWSENQAFAQVTTPLHFALNESKSYSIVWSGVLSNGTQLPAGVYRARGVIVAGNSWLEPLKSSALGSNIVNFTVR